MFSHVVKNGDKEALADYLWGKDTLDLLNLNSEIYFSASEFLALLKPLTEHTRFLQALTNIQVQFI